MTYDPAGEVLRFSGLEASGEVTVFTPSGCLVLKTALKPEISLGGLPSGFYLVSWLSGNLRSSAKLAK